MINAPLGYQKIRVHLILAVKYDGRHKARLVADGHLTPEPVELRSCFIEKLETSYIPRLTQQS